MTQALLIGVTVVVAALAAVFSVLYFSNRKTDSSYAALAVVFLVAAVFSGAILALYCADSHELSLSDVLSFYGTVASVLASAYLGYVVYKIEKDEVHRNNSCCCIMNKIVPSEEETVTEPVMDIRWVTNDVPEVFPPESADALEEPILPEALQGMLAVVGRGYARLQADSLLEKIKDRMKAHPSEKQPAIMLFSVENHGPAFLQNIRFSFDSKMVFSTALVMANTPDHKAKWFFLPGEFEDGQRVLVTFTSCYGNKTYADLKLVDIFPKTHPGLFFSCKHYHYHGAKKPTDLFS